MSQIFVYLASVAITMVIQWSGFLAAFALQTEVFYDIAGGLNFMVLAAFSIWDQPQGGKPWIQDARKIACTVVFVCSRGWLLLFLAWRAHDRKGDVRFDGVTDKFWKFLLFWTVQGIWVIVISMPMLFVNSSAVYQPQFSIFDYVTLGGFALGVVLEVVADVQKAVWVKAGRSGGFCKVGIWGFSRHPNYFGEMLQWWSVWLFAYSSSSGPLDALWWTCISSPLFTMHVLMNIPATGLAQANGKGLARYYEDPNIAPEYIEYRNNTSILFPMMGYAYLPMFLKRTLLCDFNRYEYHANVYDQVKKNG